MDIVFARRVFCGFWVAPKEIETGDIFVLWGVNAPDFLAAQFCEQLLVFVFSRHSYIMENRITPRYLSACDHC